MINLPVADCFSRDHGNSIGDVIVCVKLCPERTRLKFNNSIVT